jgi:hypothetical protein
LRGGDAITVKILELRPDGLPALSDHIRDSLPPGTPEFAAMELSVGRDAIGVQIDGDNNYVLIAGATRLVLDRRHLAKAAASTERDLLLTERRATDLVGREADLAALHTWLEVGRRLKIGKAHTPLPQSW